MKIINVFFKKNILLILFILLFFQGNFYSFSQPIPLFVNNYSDYVIHLSKNPSPNMSTAVDELRIYLKKITGIQLPCTDRYTDKGSFISFEEGYCSDSNFDIHILNKDGFRIKNRNGNIVISAADGQGLINAVYVFLEKYIGCRYFSEDEIYIPQKKEIVIDNLSEDIQNPSYIFRTIHYYNAYQKEFAKLNRLHNSTPDRISNQWGLWVHTLHRLVPPEKYFNKHPEYFALRNGIRIKDQLCLSNKDVINTVVSSLREMMKKLPSAKYWSVSQMDNYNYCECEQCKLTDSIEGSHSGSIIRFVNEIASYFPDKVISTLAYQYSRKPPLQTIPAANVNIMLCSIESDRNKPIADDYSEGSFYDDLSNWSLITQNIIIWDYVTNFSHLVSPFPNFQVLQPNIQLFSNYGANMIFEQGYAGKAGEMNELRCYLLAKLIWNPNEDVNSLINDFLIGYYGKAAPFIRNYIDLATSELIKSEKSLTLYEPQTIHSEGYLSASNLYKYFQLFRQALNAVYNDSIKTHRVQMAMQSIRYAWLEVCKYNVYNSDWVFQKIGTSGSYKLKPEAIEILETFYKFAKNNGPSILHEIKNTPDEYYHNLKQYFQNAIVEHKAVGKKITFEKPYSRKYKANGQNTLIDGIKGTQDYQVLWQAWYGDYINATIDFDTAETLNSVELSFIDDNLSWIMPPESIEVSASNDSVNFEKVIFFTNPEARKKQEPQIVTFKLPFSHPVNARFLNVKIKNIGKLPEWRGVNDNAWLFVDEIIVR